MNNSSLARRLLKSIRARLIILLTLASTLLLGTFGIYAHVRLSDELEARFALIREGALTRLKLNLPGAMWNYDEPIIGSIIESEMLQREIRSIFVFTEQGRFIAGITRDPADRPVATSDFKTAVGIPVVLDIYPPKATPGAKDVKPQGSAHIYFSRDLIEEALRSEISRRVVEVLAVDLLFIVILTLSLRMVFNPLGRLRDALFGLAADDKEYVEELQDAQASEFSDVIRGFNQTLRKLRRIIVRALSAEEAAKSNALKIEEAYEKLQAAQESLVQSEKLAGLGGLVAGIAHEVNTPVGITLTTASVLADETRRMSDTVAQGGLKKSEVLAYFKMADESSQLIVKNASRAAGLIQSFKQVAVDQTSEQRRQYDLKEYINEVLSSLESKLKAAGVQVKVICPVPITLDGYPGAMAQVITNLTMNALAHAFESKESDRVIEITATLRDDKVQMSFADNGCGIAAANLGKIFDPFFTTKRGEGGTGLGLNIVFNILNQKFGGSISVQSELGHGACFLMNFPRVSAESVGTVS